MDYTSNNFDVFFTSSNDNGQTFKSPLNLSNNAGDSAYPQVSAVGNNVYVTWFDSTEGFFKILFTVSNDNGQTFSTLLNLTNTVDSQNPQIAVAPLELENK
jgi:hypothetical protein